MTEMNAVEFIRVEIPRENYERKITDLITALLELDEMLFPAENKESLSPKEAA